MDAQDTVQAVLMTPMGEDAGEDPRPDNLISVHLTPYDLPASEIANESLWRHAPVTTKLGFPLKVSISPIEPSDEKNNCKFGLFIDSDPKSRGFGACDIPIGEPTNGAFPVARYNGKPLHYRQLRAVFLYNVETFGATINAAFRSSHPEVQRPIRASIVKKLNPRAFAAYFQEQRQKETAAGDEIWPTVDNPVKVEYSTEACAVCHAKEGNGGQTLKLCVRCKAARYCGKECQKRDWKQHKFLCKLAARGEIEEKATEP